MKCQKCGYPYNPDKNGDKCLMCGFYFPHRYKEIEVTDNVCNKKRLIRLQSFCDVYYEYDSNMPPVRVDSWGGHYIGKCFSKADSCFLKQVVICVIPDDAISLYVNSMWNYLKQKPHLVNTKTVFIPIIDKIDDYPRCYFVEDFIDGISLYDLMHGQVCGVDGHPIEYAAEMYDMYQNNRTGFVKKVAIEILGGIKNAHDLGVRIRFIEPPENILFTKSGEIKIRITNSLLVECDKRFTIIPWVYYSLLNNEYESPEGLIVFNPKVDQRSEIYTVGILAYCILTGHLPYQGRSSLEDSHSVHHGPIIDSRDEDDVNKSYIGFSYDKSLLDEIMDKNLKTIIEKATKQTPDERFQFIEDFISALEDNEIVKSYVCRDSPSPWYKRLYSSIYNFIGRNRLLLFILLVFIFCADITAQNTIRIHSKNGGVYEVQTENVDSITFGDADSLNVVEIEFAGSWLWGSAEKGYYELLSFSKDHTYTAYDNYFTYGFDTTTYGFYSQYSAMLTLWSNGFGYQHRYNWYVTGLSANALSVMTKMGPFTYYRLQPEILNIRVGNSIECADDDSFVFADGVVVNIEDGKLYGIKGGTTFIQKYIASTGLIYAYKVVVE